MFLTEQTVNVIGESLKQRYGGTGNLEIISMVSGGSINKCFKIRYGSTLFFLKVNLAERFPQMFAAEAEGLKRVGLTKTIKVPEVMCFGNAADEQFLVLEWVDQGINNSKAQQEFGSLLALLHNNKSERFGLDHNNYMGSLVQTNNLHSSCSDFYINERFIPQVELAARSGLLSAADLKLFESLYARFNSLIPQENAAFVHGDLWSGNYLIAKDNQPVLIDPAISFAHRESDIAMTTLFGGFQKSFYDAYNEVFPLLNGWEKRLDLWNLYPLLVHVNLFGLSYVAQVKEVLERFK